MLIDSRVLLGKLDILYALGGFKSTDDYDMVINAVITLNEHIVRCKDCKFYNKKKTVHILCVLLMKVLRTLNQQIIAVGEKGENNNGIKRRIIVLFS